MVTVLLTILVVLVLGVLAAVVYALKAIASGQSRGELQARSVEALSKQVEQLRDHQTRQGETLDKNLREGQANLTRFLQNNQEALTRLHKEIGQVQSAGRQMVQVAEQVQKLGDIFKNPKRRGQLGELSLSRILEEILPAESFSLQHTFSNHKIADAVITLPEAKVAVDAKFPLPAFERILEAEDDAERERARRQFLKDVTLHIDKIAADYILPEEGTLDFALMYVPAENVYYEMITTYDSDKVSLLDRATAKRVIPVSPNLLWAYLMTIVMGLRGLQIEKQAVEIRRNLGKLSRDFNAFGETWRVLGRHLNNAYSQYGDGCKQLDRLNLALDQIHAESEKENL